MQVMIRALTENALERGFCVFIFNGELYKAYDTVDHGVWADAFSEEGVPNRIT